MTFESILHSHIARYPAMQIRDVYKLVHQAALGSEHAISVSESARKWMEREIAEMGVGPVEPMIDPISEDDHMLRVHLRPFVTQGGNPEILLDAFVRTANEYRGNVEYLMEYWEIATAMEHFSTVEMDEFIRIMQVQDYPATHHSPEYESLYHPAYRVIWRKFYA